MRVVHWILDTPKINPMHMPNPTLEDPMHGMQPFEKRFDFILISPSLLPFQLHRVLIKA